MILKNAHSFIQKAWVLTKPQDWLIAKVEIKIVQTTNGVTILLKWCLLRHIFSNEFPFAFDHQILYFCSCEFDRSRSKVVYYKHRYTINS